MKRSPIPGHKRGERQPQQQRKNKKKKKSSVAEPQMSAPQQQQQLAASGPPVGLVQQVKTEKPLTSQKPSESQADHHGGDELSPGHDNSVGAAAPAVDEGNPWSTSRPERVLAAGKVVGESKNRKESSPTSDDSNHEDAENLPPTSDDNNDEDAKKNPVANDDNNAEGSEHNSPTSDDNNDASDPPPINYVGQENSQALMDLFGLTVSATAAVLKPLADKAQQESSDFEKERFDSFLPAISESKEIQAAIEKLQKFIASRPQKNDDDADADCTDVAAARDFLTTIAPTLGTIVSQVAEEVSSRIEVIMENLKVDVFSALETAIGVTPRAGGFPSELREQDRNLPASPPRNQHHHRRGRSPTERPGGRGNSRSAPDMTPQPPRPAYRSLSRSPRYGHGDGRARHPPPASCKQQPRRKSPHGSREERSRRGEPPYGSRGGRPTCGSRAEGPTYDSRGEKSPYGSRRKGSSGGKPTHVSRGESSWYGTRGKEPPCGSGREEPPYGSRGEG